MTLIPYRSANWSTHQQVGSIEIDFPLSEQSPDHFTLRRRFEGARSSYKRPGENQLDTVFSGAAIAATATASDDIVALGADYVDLFTGLRVTVTAGTAGGIATGTYYLIRLSDSTVKLANTRALARAGTAVDVSGDGTLTITLPAAYLVRESGLTDVRAGNVRYDWTFATVPASWSEPTGSFAFTFPAVTPGSVGTSRAVTAIAESGANFVLTTTGDPALASGDACYVSVKFTRGGLTYQWSGYTRATAASTGTTATIGNVFGFLGSGAFTAVSGIVIKATTGRTVPEELVVGARIVHDYALSSTAALESDLPSSQRFSPVISSTAVRTDYLTTGTTPTAAEYHALVAASAELVAEASSHARYLGNIYVRRTRFVPAR